MTNWIQWAIDDEDGENPLGKPGEFEFNVAFDYDPGDPGYMYDANGDGYPGHPPNATITGAECIVIRLEELPQRPPTEKENKMLEDWFLNVLDHDKKLCQQIEACGLDQMCVEPDCDDWDD